MKNQRPLYNFIFFFRRFFFKKGLYEQNPPFGKLIIVIFAVYKPILHIEPVHKSTVKIVCSVKIHLSIITNHQKKYPDMATRPLF